MQSDSVSVKKERKVYLDLIRILAAFCVIFNHTNDNGFFLFAAREWGSFTFWGYMFFSVFCKAAVPLFLMISGALILSREDEPLPVLGRRILRVLAVIVLFVFYNYAVDWYHFGESITLKKIFTTVYTGNSAGYTYWYGHLWYLYAYLAYLLCLPFLRALVKKLETKFFYYMIALALAVQGVLPAAEYLLSGSSVVLNGDLRGNLLILDIVLYPCIGYFLEHRVTLKPRSLKWLWLANFAGIGATELLIYRQALATQVLNRNESQGFHGLFVLINCIAVFLTIKYLCANYNLPGLLKKAIHSVGQCTFGIYLIHIMILHSNPMYTLLEYLVMYINSMAACFLQCGCVMLIAYVITLVLRKIPVLGKLLN